MTARRLFPFLFLVAVSSIAATCTQEKGTIEVHSLALKGVKQLDPSAIESVLATKASSRLPWGKKYFFDRTKFDADLQRIHAYYVDHGFPNGHVTGSDVKLNKAQTRVDITLNVSEGTPIRVAAINVQGFQELPATAIATFRKQAPLKVGQPLDNPELITTREMALNMFRDNGYPYARVAWTQSPGPKPETFEVTLTATPGTKAYFGPIQIGGNSTVGDEIIRRQLLFKPGQMFQRSKMLESQRKLYDMQLFQFASIRMANPEQTRAQEPAEVPTKVTVTEGKTRRLQFSGG